MKRYELMYIISGTTTDEQKDQAIDTINTFITKNEGAVESVEKLGNKKFAYEINKMKEGFYVLEYFTAPSEVLSKIDNFLNITENILRHIVIAK